MTGFALLPAFHHRLHLARRPGTDKRYETLNTTCGCPAWTKQPDRTDPVTHCRCCGACHTTPQEAA